MALKDNFKDQIPEGGKRLYQVIDGSTGAIIHNNVQIARSNGNTQEGDKYGANEVNEERKVINQLSNSNLLINGDFQIWQRGLDFNPAPSVKYTADRWLLYNSETSRMYYAESLKKGYVDNKGNTHIKQYVEKDSEGDIYTMSFSYRLIGTSLDKIISVTGTMSETATIKENDDVVIKFGYDNVRKCQYVDIGLKKITEYQLNYVKFECGEIATPLVPRPWAEELMLCQRDSMYYEEITSDVHTHYISKQNDAVVGEIHLPSCLRVKPTVSCSGITIRAINTSNSYKGKIHASRLNGNILYITIKKSDDSVLPLSTDGGYILVLSGLLIDAEIY